MQEQLIKLELNVNEINLILKGLSELPFKMSNDLIIKIMNIGENQIKQNVSKDTIQNI